MRKFVLPLFLLSVLSCTSDNPEPVVDNLVSREIFTTSIGGNEVFGVAIKATTDEKIYKGFAINFAVNEKVWIDTLTLELNPGDTLEGEIIFSEAEVKENSLTELKIESYTIGK